MRTHPGMHFFSGDSPSAKSNQVKNYFLRCLPVFFTVKDTKHLNLIFVQFAGSIETHLSGVRKAEPRYKICARDERGSSPYTVRFQERS